MGEPEASCFLRTPGLHQTEVDDDLVVYDPVRCRAITFNPTARAVWERCDGTLTETDIVSQLTDLFDADREVIGREVGTLLAHLRTQGLISVVSGTP